MMNKNDLIPRLVAEFGYPPRGAEIVAGDLLNCAPQIQQAFINYWETGEIPLLEIEGYSVANLGKDHRMTPIAALLTLDWLIKEPERAKKSLKRGHDFIVPKKPKG